MAIPVLSGSEEEWKRFTWQFEIKSIALNALSDGAVSFTVFITSWHE